MGIFGGYDRRRAIEDGLLIDVSESIGEPLGLPYPVAVSAAVWDHPEIEHDPRHLRTVVWAASTRPRWLEGLEAGELSGGEREFPCNAVLLKATHAGVVRVRIIFEATGGSGLAATIVGEGEVLGPRDPRAVSSSSRPV